ncbi:hypothetical protein SAY86_030953 [Trapa natans]|uniref:Uncharacterized protein n=1 Tax=Trapa natans TaxID=22666 RepID=A0AAN7M5V7_TRANT|nr:hypothetical protein SAY86_030953 [Trapa natans]
MQELKLSFNLFDGTGRGTLKTQPSVSLICNSMSHLENQYRSSSVHSFRFSGKRLSFFKIESTRIHSEERSAEKPRKNRRPLGLNYKAPESILNLIVSLSFWNRHHELGHELQQFGAREKNVHFSLNCPFHQSIHEDIITIKRWSSFNNKGKSNQICTTKIENSL